MSYSSQLSLNAEYLPLPRIQQNCDAFDHLITLALEGTLPQSELPELREELDHLLHQQ